MSMYSVSALSGQLNLEPMILRKVNKDFIQYLSSSKTHEHLFPFSI